MSKSVEEGDLIHLHYTLSTEETVIDSTMGQAPLEITIGKGEIHSLIERQLLGLQAEEKFEKVLDPSLAFGEYDPNLKIQVAKVKLPEKWHSLKRGMAFETLDHNKKMRLYRVLESNDAFIVIDGNHPLAGEVIYLEGEIVGISAPTAH